VNDAVFGWHRGKPWRCIGNSVPARGCLALVVACLMCDLLVLLLRRQLLLLRVGNNTACFNTCLECLSDVPLVHV
jgi:hypothetical protein